MFLLSAAGLWISVYFTSVFYSWTRPDVFWLPRFCRLEESACQTILKTPEAAMFGVPNSVFGIALYAYLMFGFKWFPPWDAFGMLVLAAARSVYLAYRLLVVLKTSCFLCFASHVINFVLLFLVLNRMHFG